MTQRWSMRTRFVAAASLCLLPLLGVVLYILDQSLVNSRDQVYDTQFAFAEVVSRGINQTLTENEQVLANLAANSNIQMMTTESAQEVLSQANELRPSLTGFFLLNPEQQVVAYSGGIDPSIFLSQIKPAGDVALTSGESAITNTMTVQEGDVEVIAMVLPVLAEAESEEESGTPVGAIGSFLSVDRLQRSFFPVTGEADSRTTVALVTDSSVIADQGSPGDDSASLMENLQPEIAESVSGKRLRLTYEDSDGNNRQGVMMPVEFPGAQWAVAVTGPSPTTYGPNRDLLRDGLIALALAVGLTLLLATIFGEMTARPLRRLSTQASSIAAGDLEQNVDVVGRGEVLELSGSVNEMANRLTEEVHEAETAREDMALQNDLMREVLRRTIRLQEDERRRIAADIHDAVSPLITGALYRIRALVIDGNGNGSKQPEADEAGDSVNQGLVETGQLLEESMDELHNVIFALRPPDLDDVGIEAAVERYVNQINRTGLPCELEVIGDQRRLSPETRLGVYRIVQEALHNSLRHAHADEAVVLLEFLDDELRASVRDNGSGFDTESAARTVSLGLLSMQERAAAIGASLEIVSRPGAGTIVMLRRPWESDLMQQAVEESPEQDMTEQPLESEIPDTEKSEEAPAPVFESRGVAEAHST